MLISTYVPRVTHHELKILIRIDTEAEQPVVSHKVLLELSSARIKALAKV